jgi:hypothetical protein
MMKKERSRIRARTQTQASLYPISFAAGVLLVFALLVIEGFFLIHLGTTVADHDKTIVNLSAAIEELDNTALQTSKPVETNESLSGFTEKEAVAFLQEEAISHREFIESEREFLTWTLATIVGIALGVLGFIGIKQRKDAERIMEEGLAQKIDEKITRYIGGESRAQYLQESIDREKRLQETPLLFIKQDSPGKEIEAAYQQLIQNGHTQIKSRNISQFQGDYLEEKYDDCGVWIYETAASSEEEEKAGFYKNVSDYCNEKKIFCIFYAKGRLDADKVYTLYTAPGQTTATILERLYGYLNYWK